MTLDGWLLVAQRVLLVLLYPMAFVLIRAACRRPRIWALNIMALATFAIAVGITAYQLAIANAAAGYPVPSELAKIALRLALIAIEALPLLFFWVYYTGRFRDGRD